MLFGKGGLVLGQNLTGKLIPSVTVGDSEAAPPPDVRKCYALPLSSSGAIGLRPDVAGKELTNF